MNARRAVGTMAVAVLALAIGRVARASDAPHNAANLPNTCRDCHTIHNAAGPSLTKDAANANLCISCHQTKTNPTVVNWQAADQATPGASGSSHRWDAPASRLDEGAQPPTSTALLQGLAGGTTLQCSTCHDQHTQANAPFDPSAPSTVGSAGRHFQAVANNANQMCLDCHAPWNQASAAAGTYYTAGTATFTNGNATVSGTSTVWSGNVQPGWMIKPLAAPSSAWAVVKAVNGNTSITLTAPFSGTSASAVAYVAAKTLTHPVGVALAAGDFTFTPPAEVGGAAQVAGYWGTATGGSTTSLVDTGKNFSSPSAVGWKVRFTGPSTSPLRNTVATITSLTGTTQINFAALGTAVSAGTTYEIDVDGNFTNNIHLSNGTSASFTTGNVVCMSCHGVHFADSSATSYDDRPPAPAGAGDGTLLRRSAAETCAACHPSTLLHNSTNVGTKHGTWGATFTCLTCHDVHKTGNVNLVGRTIATPNNGSRDVDLRATGGGVENYGLANAVTAGTGPCETCHTDTRNGGEVTGATSTFTAGGTSVTLSSTAGLAANWEIKRTADGPLAWTRIATVVNGTSATLATGYKGTSGGANWQGANPRFRNTGSGRGAAGTEHYVTACLGCHPHKDAFKGAGESTGGAACDGCHNDLTSRMALTSGGTTLGGKAIVTRHTVQSFSPSDSGGPTWASPLNAVGAASRSCVNMCHGDHTHDLTSPVVATHEYNAYLDATSAASRADGTGGGAQTRTSTTRAKTDFDSTATNGGMCLSCHRYPVDSSVPVQHPPIDKTAFTASAHNYASNTVGGTAYDWTYTQHDGATFARNCTKCHSERADARPNDATVPFEAVHYSSNPSLLAGNVSPAASGNVAAEYVCFNCHGDNTNGQDLSGKNLYGEVTSTFKHPTNSDQIHNTITEAGAAAADGKYSGANRHVNCLDCHDPHEAKPVATVSATGTAGTATFTQGTDPALDTLTDSTKTWTTNAWKGYQVKIVSATTGAGYVSVIYKNTGNALQVKFPGSVTGTIQYVILPTGTASGNQASGPISGVPVAGPSGGTWPAQPAPPTWNDSLGTSNASPFGNGAAGLGTNVFTNVTWTTSVTGPVEGNLCIRCHSSFAYGTAYTSMPNTPSGAPGTSWTAANATAMVQGDKANEFNPNNLSHHAVFAPGRNQPMVSGAASYYNPNWPKFINGTGITVSTAACSAAPCNVTLTGTTWPATVLPGWFINIGSNAPAQGATTWYKVVAVPSDTVLQVDRTTSAATGQAFILTAGLANNFVPPFGPWSTIACSDCHASNTASDPFGPHGSAYKYLTSGTRTMKFLQYTGTASSPTAVTMRTSTPSDSYVLCVNCHWREVYGDNNYASPTSGNWSRVPHPVDGRGDMYVTAFAGNGSKWGIACMTCHGGARSGGIHGENVGVGNNGGTGTPASQSGKRMLAGSSWYAVTRPTTTSGSGHCWTKAAADSVDTCTHNHKDQTQGFQTATYNYDAP